MGRHAARKDCPSCIKDVSLEQVLKAHGLLEFLGVLEKEKLDLESLVICSDAELKELGIPLGPRKKLLSLAKEMVGAQEKQDQMGEPAVRPVPEKSSQAREQAGSGEDPQRPLSTSSITSVSYEQFDVGIGQVSVNYPPISFQPDIFFAFGSPIGMFLTVRGLKRIDPNYTFPTCKRFFNIYHPVSSCFSDSWSGPSIQTLIMGDGRESANTSDPIPFPPCLSVPRGLEAI
ncbi:hypothetical protein chiPu_0017710 [Chiloscyllium punctatum]|uniref:DDHD domain-containing protein n=1 Tax=Chiloscyllium punctatum TaxID=137246 RepID=A0A401RIE1_CHIPU|nr:hypothetical protein [Chiloscyllium punctatum]